MYNNITYNCCDIIAVNIIITIIANNLNKYNKPLEDLQISITDVVSILYTLTVPMSEISVIIFM